MPLVSKDLVFLVMYHVYVLRIIYVSDQVKILIIHYASEISYQALLNPTCCSIINLHQTVINSNLHNSNTSL